MIVFPAIDLRRGRCVRLVQGDPGQETVFGDDPVEVALRWKEEGANWLHVVNLDGALGYEESSADNLSVVARIAAEAGLPVQFGGGLRHLEDVDLLLSLGVSRVVMGTVALSEPQLLEQCIRVHGADRVALALDAREGYVATHGWQSLSQVTPVELALRMRDGGLQWVIYTDISRDGMLQGVNVLATVSLARETGMNVVASGGVASVDDVRRLKACEPEGIHGVIIGKALYSGRVDLKEALTVAHSSSQGDCISSRSEG